MIASAIYSANTIPRAGSAVGPFGRRCPLSAGAPQGAFFFWRGAKGIPVPPSPWEAPSLHSAPFDHYADLVDAAAIDEPRPRRSFGFGIGTSDDGFRVNIAHPLDGDGEAWRLWACLSRSF